MFVVSLASYQIKSLMDEALGHVKFYIPALLSTLRALTPFSDAVGLCPVIFDILS